MWLQVTFENVGNCIVPEDVELRLIKQSRGVSKATQTMHKYVTCYSLIVYCSLSHLVSVFTRYTLAESLAPRNRCSPRRLLRALVPHVSGIACILCLTACSFTVCCTAPAIPGAFPSRVEWQPFSAGAAIGPLLAVFVNAQS